MAFRWCAPDKNMPGKALRVGSGFATKEDAIKNAVFNASLRHIDDIATLNVLWASLERAGWRIDSVRG